MARLIPLVCIVLMCFVVQDSTVNANPLKALQYAYKAYKFVKKIEKYITHKPSKEQKIMDAINSTKIELLKSLNDIPNDIRDLKGSAIQKIDNIKTKVEVDSDKFFDYVSKIDAQYNRLLLYIEEIPTVENKTWKDFIDGVTAEDSDKSSHIDEVHKALTIKDLKQSSLLFKLTKMDMELMCARNQSSEEVIIELYEIVKLTAVKDLVMKLFAFNLNKQFDPSTKFEGEINIAVKQFLSRMNATYDAVRNATKIASRDLYRCDPNEDKKGITYANVCDGNLNVNNYFSLAGSYADTDKNYIVTGAQIVLINNVFYIKIQQGLLGPNATIVPDTIHWKPVKELSEIHRWGRFQNAYRVDDKQHSVYLDDVEPSKTDDRPNQVVTGLKFGQVGDNLQLQVATMSYNEDNQLFGVNMWHNSGFSQKRTELRIGTDDPMNFPKSLKHTQNSRHGQFVKFSFGENTVPFIDIQGVASNPAVPLSGAGLFHRGQYGSSGYLALKLIHYDLTNEI